MLPFGRLPRCLGVAWIVFSLCTGTADDPPRIHLQLRNDGSGDRVFAEVDTGRERVFHGTNVVVKGPPWLPRRDSFDPLTSLVDKDFRFLRDAGMNLLRLGVSWAGGEPERGHYDDAYLQGVRQIVEDAAAEGIYVLLDMHQDVLSEKFCGEGLPPWAVRDPKSSGMKFPVPLQVKPASVGEDGFPTRKKCQNIFKYNPFQRDHWDVSHMAFATQYAYESLYLNSNGLTDAWGAFLAKLASKVKGLTNVLGIELINEPFAGNVIGHPELLLPGKADRQRLQAAYDIVARHIRKVDQDILLFFEGVTWDNDHSVGFSHAPGGPEWANVSVLAYHYYRPPQPKDKPFSLIMEARQRDARRLGTGLLMTESCCGNIESAFPGLAAAGQSWVQWEWKDWCRENETTLNWSSQNAEWGACKTGFGAGPFSVNPGSETPNEAVMKKLAQPYAEAIAGTLNGTKWDSSSGVFELRFQAATEITAPTIIFVNRALSFPNGMSISIKPDGIASAEESQDTNKLLVRLNADYNGTDHQVIVRIKRKRKRFWWPFLRAPPPSPGTSPPRSFRQGFLGADASK